MIQLNTLGILELFVCQQHRGQRFPFKIHMYDFNPQDIES